MSFDLQGAANDADDRTRRYARHFAPHPGAAEALRLLLRSPHLGEAVAAFIKQQPDHVPLDVPVNWDSAAAG